MPQRSVNREALRGLVIAGVAPVSAPLRLVQRLEEAQIANAELKDLAGLWTTRSWRRDSAGATWPRRPATCPRCCRRATGTMAIPNSVRCPRSGSTPRPSWPGLAEASAIAALREAQAV
jgi:hypothetical protein